ncbi:hypothetical protein PV342_38485 [Streptomyces sp. PA03-3a]|nr:hypothetical protein [Streptomyces sp. PA03-3a]
MLEQALTALAAAGGSAVVQAAGTDAWAGLRQAVARWFSRDDSGREQTELERLNRTAAALQSGDPAQAERIRIREEVSWQTRIHMVLEAAGGAEQEQSAAQLRAIVEQYSPPGNSGVISGNTFNGPTALQVGDHNTQNNTFG